MIRTRLALGLLASAAWMMPAAADAADAVDFQRHVAPLLSACCVSCHSAGQAKGGLDLSSRAGALRGGENGASIVPGRPAESWLLDMIVSGDKGRPEMPAKGEPLSAAEVKLVREWIAAGASWPEKLVLHEPAKAGADWWSLVPLAKAEPPAPASLPAAWKQSPIDRFVGAKLIERHLSPNPEADRRTLIRRVTYDLLGLPPTPEETAGFVHDSRPDAYERLVDRLLASPYYGEQWGRHWLDVIRFGESRGFERNQIVTNAWPFRDYVIRSFNDDKPFDQLVVEHLAGDVIGKDRPEVEVGTTFLVCGAYDDVGNKDPVAAAQIRANTLDDMIRATAEAFLGLTVGCARCHDHKFDPIRQDDYYSLFATFAGVTHGERTVATAAARQARQQRLAPLEREQQRLTDEKSRLEEELFARGTAREAEISQRWKRPTPMYSLIEESFAPAKARYVRLVVEATSRMGQKPASKSYDIDEFEVFNAAEPPQNVALASVGAKAAGAHRVAEDFAEAYGPQFTIDGKYASPWNASGPELKITLAREEVVRRVVFSSNRNADFMRAFPAEYRVEVSRDGHAWTKVADSHDRQPVSQDDRRRRLIEAVMTAAERQRLAEIGRELKTVEAAIAKVPALPTWWVGNFTKGAGPFRVFLGGDPQRPGGEVQPASLSTLSGSGPTFRLPADAPEGQRRLALARWLVDPRLPLAARVMANRLWQFHFGTGLVDTPSDFGYLGSRPTHPELLDWLARRLIEHGWRLKPLSREIVLSQAYRQAGTHRAQAARVDAGSRYLWRFPPRRLSAEELRDTVLAVSGKLDPRMGGPGFLLYRYLQDNVATYVPLDAPGPETYRRAVYHHFARASRVDLLSEFDCPDAAQATPSRVATTSPLQALTLLNHRFTLDMSRFFAERLRREAGPDKPREQVRLALELVGGLPLEGNDEQASIAFVQQYGLPAFCRALLNSNQLLYLD
jgi:mono/diheme cytochrome c family protein